jgi:hypothetical protein
MSKAAKSKHYKLMRDDGRPIEFDGVQVAEEELSPAFEDTRSRAAVYQTVGGRFVSEYTKWEVYQPGDAASRRWEVVRAKVAAFDTLEDAVEWFRPGPITTALLAKLQDQLQGERIE